MLPLFAGIDCGSGAGGMEDVVPFLLSMKTHCCGDDESSSSPSSFFIFASTAALSTLAIYLLYHLSITCGCGLWVCCLLWVVVVSSQHQKTREQNGASNLNF